MSEANAPIDRPNPSDAETAAPDWENPFAALVAEAEWESSTENPLFEQDASQQTDQSFPSRIDQTSESNSAAATRAALPDPIAAIATWSETAAHSTDSTEITDLISLIQELNQCNSILLDRVSQLEEALESSQTALQAEVGRSQDYQAIASQISADPVEDPTAAQEQIISLFNQLEFAHQTHQRQQILIETLTGQLEASQERVAQLERETALLQQHYSDRLQLLAQAEGTNRDLQARLHRQQRYTLQFKVALEKCLEVPAPQYDLGETAAIEGEFLLPRTQRIQPWAADEISTPRAAWMKLHSLGLEGLGLEQLEEAQLVTPQPAIQAEPASIELANPVEETQLKRPAIQLPEPQLPLTEQTANLASAIASEPAVSPAVSYDLRTSSIPVDAPIAEPMLMQQIDAAMQPLAVQLVDALRAEASLLLGNQSAANPDRGLSVELPTELPVAQSTDLPEQFSQPLVESQAENLAEFPIAPPAEPGNQLVEPNGDAEDDLWQDLARLIEVSTEDVVKASLAGDFTAFEAIDFAAIQAQSSPSQSDPAQSDETLSQPLAIPPEPLASPQATPQPDAHPQADSFIPALNHSTCSPVVYPLRPTKKQRSPGAIDLPCFARQDANPEMA